MVYSVDWANKIVTVPKADMTLISASPEVYELDVELFWMTVHDIQDGEGMPYDQIMESNAPVTLSGVLFARQVRIINGYQVEFENGAYRVNLVGANNNILDVKYPNTVSVASSNSAGLQIVSAGSGLSTEQDAKLSRVHALLDVIEGTLDHAELMRLFAAALLGKASGAATTEMRFRDMADSKDRIVATVDASGNRTAVTVDAA